MSLCKTEKITRVNGAADLARKPLGIKNLSSSRSKIHFLHFCLKAQSDLTADNTLRYFPERDRLTPSLPCRTAVPECPAGQPAGPRTTRVGPWKSGQFGLQIALRRCHLFPWWLCSPAAAEVRFTRSRWLHHRVLRQPSPRPATPLVAPGTKGKCKALV